MGQPRLDVRTEVRTALIYLVVVAALVAMIAWMSTSGAVPADSHEFIIPVFALGLIGASGIASSLTFLISLRHLLLVVSLSFLMLTAGALMLHLGTLESLAKVVFASTFGLWISLMLTSIGQVTLISVLIILVDFYSVFLGPTRKMVESGGPWLDYLTINLPAWGTEAISRLGASDIIFFSLFVGCTLTFSLRRTLTALAMTLSFVATMVVGVSLDIGVPALPLLSIFFLLANGDLIYHRFLQEPGSGGDDRRRY